MDDTLSRFTVRTKPVIRYMGYACLVAAVLCVGLYFWVGRLFPGEKSVLMLVVMLTSVLAVEGIATLVLFQRVGLQVSGSHLFSVFPGGKTVGFNVQDIAFVTRSKGNVRTLFGHDGQMLAVLNQNMDNIPLLDQYLAHYSIPVREVSHPRRWR